MSEEITFQTGKSYSECINLLKEASKQKNYKNTFLRKQLRDKEGLRETFISVAINNPARKQDIQESSHYASKTIYAHLYQLIALGLVKKMPVMEVYNKSNLTSEESEVLEKFKKWTQAMPEGKKQYFAAKTNYWLVTDTGRDDKLINWVYRIDTSTRE